MPVIVPTSLMGIPLTQPKLKRLNVLFSSPQFFSRFHLYESKRLSNKPDHRYLDSQQPSANGCKCYLQRKSLDLSKPLSDIFSQFRKRNRKRAITVVASQVKRITPRFGDYVETPKCIKTSYEATCKQLTPN